MNKPPPDQRRDLINLAVLLIKELEIAKKILKKHGLEKEFQRALKKKAKS